MSADALPKPEGPYPGLRPFEPHEASLFFGRAEQIVAMLTKLETRRFLAVVGSSGSGKSSLVRAGLLPALRDGFLMGTTDDWLFVIARPGSGPYASLADSFCRAVHTAKSEPTAFERSFAESQLRSGRLGMVELIKKLNVPEDRHVLVLIDQFEELFRFRGLEEGDKARNDAIAFVDLLLKTAEQKERTVHVVLTMRSDFLGDCNAFFGLPEAISDSQFLTPRLTRDQLTEAIKGPLPQFGAKIEPAVVNHIVNEIGADPDQLPLMQHALMRMWEFARPEADADAGLELRADHYGYTGGVEMALTVHATIVYESLADKSEGDQPIPQQRVAQWLFRCLATRTSKGQLVRRVTTVREVAAIAGSGTEMVCDVVRTFAAPGVNFLVTSPPGPLTESTSIDICHESLLRQWILLRDWVNAESSASAELLKLVEDAALWKCGRRGFLRHPELGLFQKWRKQNVPSPAWATRYVAPEAFELAEGYLRGSQRHRNRLILGWIAGTTATLLFALTAFLIYWSHDLNVEGKLHAEALVQNLLDAETEKVPDIIDRLDGYRRWADPVLRQQNEKWPKQSRQKLHAALALLPVDAAQVDFLYERLLDAEPWEVAVIRDALEPHKELLIEKLWVVAQGPEETRILVDAEGREQTKGGVWREETKRGRRLRAASALAKYDPKNERWGKAAEAVGTDLVRAPPVLLTFWTDALRPVREKLFASLSGLYRHSRRDVERSLAADILANYAADQPKLLADLLMDADEQQFAVLFSKLRERSEQGTSVLIREIERQPPTEAKDEVKENLAKRQANAAVALLKMNQPEKAWTLLKHVPDPRARSYLIHLFGPLGVDHRVVSDRLKVESDVTIRRALILSLGGYSITHENDMIDPEPLKKIYQTADDPGLHAAAEWLLRMWNRGKDKEWLAEVNDAWAKEEKVNGKRLERIKEILKKDNKSANPQWYVNGQGQTMVVLPNRLVPFEMGSPASEALDRERDDEQKHNRTIGRTFALAAKPVTVEQYKRFQKDQQLPRKFTRTAELPVVGLNWYQAAAYCNWLSKEEGLDDPSQWCYEIKPDRTITLRKNYLSLPGYRLPTEAEMEYATRAGAVTARYYGETEELLPMYAWYVKNGKDQTWPVGARKPNDWGFFDMHGNVFTWCQERYLPYAVVEGADKEDDLKIDITVRRVLRGGSFYNQAPNIRSANRFYGVPSERSDASGIRVARTILP